MSAKGERNGQCSICRSPHRFRVEIMLAGGASCRAVAEKFALSHDAAGRHWKNHVSGERKVAIIAGPLKITELAERAAEEGLTLLDYLSLIRSTLLSQFTTAAEAGDRHGTAAVAGRLLECLREVGRLTGELARIGGGATINNNLLIVNSPAFAELQQMLLKTLAPFPDARAAVLQGLRELDGRLGGGAPHGAVAASPALSGGPMTRGPIIDAEAKQEAAA